jgi:hypothetical protein
MREKRGGPPKTGSDVVCTTCGGTFYKKRSRVLRDKLHFCSETCRTQAISANVIDRKFAQAALKKRTGETFLCCICGEPKYQKRSYIARDVNKTCGKPSCVSAYSRSLWGLPPRSESERIMKRLRPMKARATNFTASQRVAWLDDKCAHCGVRENLSLDHIIPVCAGGQSVKSNAQTLCQPCNNRKLFEHDLPLAKAIAGLS